MHIDWSWMGEQNPEDEFGTITINHGGKSISFEMNSFKEALELTTMIGKMLDNEKANCLSQISIAMLDVIKNARYS
jgi:hypothetical protein